MTRPTLQSPTLAGGAVEAPARQERIAHRPGLRDLPRGNAPLAARAPACGTSAACPAGRNRRGNAGLSLQSRSRARGRQDACHAMENGSRREFGCRVQSSVFQAGPDLRLLQAAVEATGDAILITTADLDEPGPTTSMPTQPSPGSPAIRRRRLWAVSPRFLQGPSTDRAALDRTRLPLRPGRLLQGEALNYRADGSTTAIEWPDHPGARGGWADHAVGSPRSAT